MVSGALISVPRAECLTATVSVAVFPSSYIYISLDDWTGDAGQWQNICLACVRPRV